jgi:SRSO17 transposase
MNAAEICQLQPRLNQYLSEFTECFPRQDSREHFPRYVAGQLSTLPRKSVEPIALWAGVPPRTLQQFLSSYRWDDHGLIDRLQKLVVRDHAHRHAIGVIDETSFVKKGDRTPGVQRQHCGTVGKIENCIVTVHLGYAADDFHCLLDGEPFLPESWSQDRDRCRAAGIPDDVVYRSKSDIALELYDRARANGVSFTWLTFDEWYGAKPAFLRALEQRDQQYVAEVPRSFVAWIDTPRVTDRPYRRGSRGRSRKTPRLMAGSERPQAMCDLLSHHPVLRDRAWVRYHVKDTHKGPHVWEAKHVLVNVPDEQGLPSEPQHLVIARNVLHPEELKFFLGHAPLDTPTTTLLLVAFSRWRVERLFEDDKGEVGLDHYEGRCWTGLKRHLALSAVSYYFLAEVVHETRGKKTGTDRLPGASRRGGPGPITVAAPGRAKTAAGTGGQRDRPLATQKPRRA